MISGNFQYFLLIFGLINLLKWFLITNYMSGFWSWLYIVKTFYSHLFVSWWLTLILLLKVQVYLLKILWVHRYFNFVQLIRIWIHFGVHLFGLIDGIIFGLNFLFISDIFKITSTNSICYFVFLILYASVLYNSFSFNMFYR